MAKVVHAITLLIIFTEASQADANNTTTEWNTSTNVSSTTLTSNQSSAEALQTKKSSDTETTESDPTAGTRRPDSQLTEITTHLGQLLTNTSRASHESSTTERRTTAFGNNRTESTALNTSKRSPVTNTASSKRPTTAISPGKVNTSTTASYSVEKDRLAANAGLVAVLSIFFIILLLVLFVVIVKAITSRKPQFERLDDLPMNKMSEDAPFAKCPPN